MAIYATLLFQPNCLFIQVQILLFTSGVIQGLFLYWAGKRTVHVSLLIPESYYDVKMCLLPLPLLAKVKYPSTTSHIAL